MRLSNLLFVIVVSVLVTGDALAVSTNQSTISKVPSSDGQKGHRLRTNHFAAEEEDSEDRSLTQADWKYLAKKAKSLGFDLKKAMQNTLYQQRIPPAKYLAYQNSLNRLIELRKSG
ncbi:RxLR effector protein [Phytophthora megakarya]|uniref:RxLR effector protein n=1 Tax=Phytophthora megakarya TaxID=4795 RepID=A0A225WI85_9STRA|nr:RxLR effector protein [Phytophthora megakarya]